MAFCSQCGSKLPEGARFCPECGTTVGADTTAAPDSPAAPSASSAPSPSAWSLPPNGQSANASSGWSNPPGAQPAAATYVGGEPKSGGGIGWILPALILVAALVIGWAMLSQRDGSRPIAGDGQTTETATREKTDTAGGDTSRNDGRASGEDGGSTVEIGEEPSAPADEGGGATAGLPVSAVTLDSAFARDPVDAAARYAGPIRVAGTIATMVQPGPTPSLSLEGRTRFNYMIVNFPTGYGPRLASLSKGQFIEVGCGSIRTLAGTTILQDCTLR